MNSKTKYLVFINPSSGQRNAMSHYNQYLSPHLSEYEIEVIVTQFSGHALQFISDATHLETFKGILLVSGDGLIFEVLNGLYQRKDWDKRIKSLVFGILASGTGNALASSISFQLNQSLHDLALQGSASNIVAGLKRPKAFLPLDLIEVERQSRRQEKILSFVGISIGLISDVDIGTEWIRCLGYVRAYLMVCLRIIKPKYYHVKLSYLPLEMNFVSGQIVSVPPDSKIEMPPFEEIPSDWKTETGDFILIYAENVPLLDSLTLMAPKSVIGDGVIWLVLVRHGMSRFQMIHWLVNADTGAHVGKPGVDILPVRAFRIEPYYPQGILTIDGENYPFESVQGQILSNKAMVMADV